MNSSIDGISIGCKRLVDRSPPKKNWQHGSVTNGTLKIIDILFYDMLRGPSAKTICDDCLREPSALTVCADRLRGPPARTTYADNHAIEPLTNI